MRRGSNSERAVHIELFEKEGKGFSAPAGVRINGNATRRYGQKSLRVTFSKKYGREGLEYPLFIGDSSQVYHCFILRNSGNDWNKTLFRDSFMQSLMAGGFADIQRSRPCIVFINGEYWGIHDIRERLDENYVAGAYG